MESSIFQNPEQKPLEELQLIVKNDEINQSIPALDKHWSETRTFLFYETPQLFHENGKNIIGAKERWLELADFILDDLNWLLRLPFYKFWSNVIYNLSIIDSITLFLQEAPTPYMLENFPKDHNLKEKFDQIRQNILIVFARLANNKESNFEYISPAKHASLLYNNYIFTVPILMDLCQQYAYDNRKVVEKIVNYVFQLQPLYQKDLEKTVQFIVEVLQKIYKRYEDCPNQIGKPVPLLERGGANVEITLFELEDNILYLIDVVSTINIFIDVYVSVVKNFCTEYFLSEILTIYNNSLPEMYKKLDILAFKSEIEKYLQLKHFLDVTRVEILNIYRKIIYSSIKEVVENKNTDVSNKKMEYVVDDFLNILSSILDKKEFIVDYNNLYPVAEDYQILLKICPELDTSKCEYIINALYTVLDESIKLPTTMPSISLPETMVVSNQYSNTKSLQSTSEATISDPSKKDIGSVPSLSSLILKVKDIFSDLGEGFIERCLKHYDYNAETVINALLEDSLPKDLKDLDRNLPIIPPDPEEALAAVDAVIGSQRLNIYDNDEFDIMSKDKVDTSRIHKGKRKDKYRNTNELLNDKTHLAETKDFYNKFSIVFNEYDDEYDDTYDGHDIDLNAQDDIEIDARPFTTPRVFYKQKSIDEEDKEDVNDFDNTKESNKDHFVQDPAEARARAEERRLSKKEFKPSQSYKVIGNPKGQGQPKEVLDNRNQKNKHKAVKGNHNRRSGAQYKRHQGMVPS